MKVGYSPGLSFKQLTGSGSRLGLTLIITFMVVSSPILIYLNPVLVSAKSNNIDTSSQHSAFSLQGTSTSPMSPTNVSPLDSGFTTQGALSSLTARPTNNIVNTNSFYDVVFLTATAGAIKTIQVTFPAGTTIPSGAFFNEAEGIGPGTASKSGQTITYTVTNAMNVPAGIKIRLEFANINNPLNPSASYKVTVTTRNAANAIIDGPTQSAVYTMKKIGVNAIADNAITTPKVADFSITNPKLGFGSVTSSKISPNSLIINSAQRAGSSVNVPQNTFVQATAVCLSSEELVGGGHLITADNALDVRYIDSIEISFNTWRVQVANAGAGAMTVQAVALCIPRGLP